MKANHFFLLSLIISILFFSCEKKINSETSFIDLTDDLGNRLSLTSYPKRIVSLAPNLTEIIFAVDAQDQLVGVTDYCTFPEEALTKQKIGNIINPNLEAIVSLKPDLVFANADGNPKPTVDKLQSYNISVFVFNVNHYSEVLDCIKKIGQITGHSSKSDSIVNDMSNFSKTLAPVKNKPKIFMILNRNPIITASGGSFLNDLFELAGGQNAVGQMSERYPTINREALIQMNPDVILIPEKDIQQLPDSEYGYFKNLTTINAVKNKKIYYINPDLLLKPGPRLMLGLKQLNGILAQ